MTEYRTVVPGVWSDVFGNEFDQGSGYLKTGIVDSSGNPISSSNPIPVEEVNPPKIDSATSSLTIVDYPHHEVHSGSHYYVEGYTTLDNGDSLYVKMVTPDTTKWSHFLWEISSSFILTTTLTENATGGMTGGGSVTPRNNNRNFADASGMVITSGVTVNTGGTIISSASWGAKSDGGGHSRDDEIILKQNTTYLRAFTSSTNSNIVSFKASWYEHTNN